MLQNVYKYPTTELDYTSTADGTVPPFRERLDSLKIALGKFGASFEAVQLEKYNDFFFHSPRD